MSASPTARVCKHQQRESAKSIDSANFGPATVRVRRGIDIDAGCGQLAERALEAYEDVEVDQIAMAVAVILGVADTRWSSMRKLLDSNLLNRLCSLNPADLSPTQLDRLQTLLQVPTFSESLDERCPAVASLARWCNAVGGVGERPGEERPGQGGLLVEPDLWLLNEAQLSAVHDLTVTKQGIGCVTFHGQTDCRELVYCLPDVVVLNPGEVVIYPNQKAKPPVGSGLNKPSTIKLYGCLPKTQVFRDEKAREKYRTRVKTMTEEKGAEFIDYDCDQGIWQFRVTHF
ncbi:Nuclear pore complex protein Nup96-like [Symbiodinium microadriaticum]|uniref:Nuclear pore complex protein Nup96-like n=1 Tax=Symbiodinium microadriaticum TaxID=2951 RepID=A0A1Q9DY92_SYMMI|nr:Nuclear pore complex protein Nup96-like [Symbiodinium microadriaticum]